MMMLNFDKNKMSNNISDLKDSTRSFPMSERLKLWKEREKVNSKVNNTNGDKNSKSTVDSNVPVALENKFNDINNEVLQISASEIVEVEIEPDQITSPEIPSSITIDISIPTKADVKQYQTRWRNVVMSTGGSPNITTSLSEDVTYIQSLWTDIGTATATAAPVVCEVGRKCWRDVRLFVSSTFTDYFAEREILVKSIIPRLRCWCEARRLTLVDIDLR
jgi:hypothetical protein